jgi:hypothetical protein
MHWSQLLGMSHAMSFVTSYTQTLSQTINLPLNTDLRCQQAALRQIWNSQQHATDMHGVFM